jgi:hypothetical protein
MYFVVSSNQAVLVEGNRNLQTTKINLLQYVGSDNSNNQAIAISELESNSNTFVESFGEYKRGSFENLDTISDSPVNINFNIENIEKTAADEEQILAQIDSQWVEYHDKINDLVILSQDPNFRQTSLTTARSALTLYDDLEVSYQNLVDLNSEIAKISYETSTDVIQLSYFYLTLAAAVSAAFATGAAILVSKRVILGDLVKKTKIELVETTLRDLLGEGADLILEVVKKETTEGKGKENRIPS